MAKAKNTNKAEVKVVGVDVKGGAKMNKKVEENNVVAFERKTKIIHSPMNRTVKQLHKLWKKNKLNFDLAIQRGEVWTIDQKTELIYSLLYGYYIPNVIAEFRENDTSIYFLDGKQRLTSLLNFIDGKWALSKKMKNIYGQNFGGFKFKDLPEDVQDAIYDESIVIIKMENLTVAERDTQFVNLNSGSQLSPIEKTRAMHSDLIKDINILVEHSFFIDHMKVSKMGDQEALLQIAMLASEGKENIKGFGSLQIRNYVLKLKEAGSTLSEDILNRIESTLDYLTFAAERLTTEGDRKAFKKTHVPILFYVAEIAMENGVEPQKFGDFINSFLIDNYSIDSIYGQACQKSVTKKDNVLLRISEMTSALEEFVPIEIVEKKVETKVEEEVKPKVEDKVEDKVESKVEEESNKEKVPTTK